MEELKLDNNKLNKVLDQDKKLPEVPRLIDGSIDLEAITLSIDEKGNRIIDNDIFDCFYKELPNKVINQSRSWRTSNGGKIKILGSDPADSYIHRLGAEASNTTQAQRRSCKDILEELARKKASSEELERLGLEEGTSNLEAATFAAVLKAQHGDIKALEYIRDTLGEKPVDKIAAEVETITAEDRERIEKILNRNKPQDIV